jgi:hypothetical protein
MPLNGKVTHFNMYKIFGFRNFSILVGHAQGERVYYNIKNILFSYFFTQMYSWCFVNCSDIKINKIIFNNTQQHFN